MSWWLLTADTLARTRFVVSPLAEAVASLKTLHRGTAAHSAERAWLDAHLPAYRRRLAGDPVTALLVRAALGRTWNATFLTPTPTGRAEAAFEDELARIRLTPPGTAYADLTLSLDGPFPDRLRRPDLPELVADLLQWVWTHTVLPSWPQRRQILEADVVARTARLSRGGWEAALDGMRPGMRWLGEDRLQITTRDYPPRELCEAQLMFVPVTPDQSWVSWDDPPRHGCSRIGHAVVYPCAGILTDTGRAPAPEALEELLGSARAGVLMLLGTPKSTTQLVALTGQGLGSVGRHLKILLNGRLIRRRRAGRSVLYYRTGLGDALVDAHEAESGLPRTPLSG